MSTVDQLRQLVPPKYRPLLRRVAAAVRQGVGPEDRVANAIGAQSQLGDDFFGGWTPDDRALFERNRLESPPAPGFITDFVGVRTASHMVPWASGQAGTTVGRLPIPDDSLRAEAIEWFALLDALSRTSSPAFTMMEVGASYGPWTCVGAVLARRAGKTDLSLTAVEASSFMCGLIAEHLKDNGIDKSVKIVHAAVASQPGTLYFPKVTSASDNGGQASAAEPESDYVGRKVEHEAVPAMTLIELMPKDRTIDLLHVDIQGHEFDVLRHAREEVEARVRHLFVGTHSRLLEGQLLEMFHGAGWELVRERPTRFSYRRELPQVTGWTTRDGGQYWRNTRLP